MTLRTGASRVTILENVGAAFQPAVAKFIVSGMGCGSSSETKIEYCGLNPGNAPTKLAILALRLYPPRAGLSAVAVFPIGKYPSASAKDAVPWVITRRKIRRIVDTVCGEKTLLLSV